jgi:hypothetical protein
MRKNQGVPKKHSRSPNFKYNNDSSFHPQTITDNVLPNWLTKIEKLRMKYRIILCPKSGRFSMDSPNYIASGEIFAERIKYLDNELNEEH